MSERNSYHSCWLHVDPINWDVSRHEKNLPCSGYSIRHSKGLIFYRWNMTLSNYQNIHFHLTKPTCLCSCECLTHIRLTRINKVVIMLLECPSIPRQRWYRISCGLVWHLKIKLVNHRIIPCHHTWARHSYVYWPNFRYIYIYIYISKAFDEYKFIHYECAWVIPKRQVYFSCKWVFSPVCYRLRCQ